MKSHYFCFLIILTSLYSFGQNSKTINNKSKLIEIENDSISKYLNNLKIEIFKDTLKFNKKDLFNKYNQTENLNEYSKIYIVDSKYFYRLDIIDSNFVKEFVNEILDIEKIEKISYSDNNICCALFGRIGIKGCIFIFTKKKSNVNYKIAGLKIKSKRKGGSNMNQNNSKTVNIRD